MDHSMTDANTTEPNTDAASPGRHTTTRQGGRTSPIVNAADRLIGAPGSLQLLDVDGVTVSRSAADPHIGVCPPWCSNPGDHSFDAAAEDRAHYSGRTVLPLSLETAELVERTDLDEELRYRLQTMEAYLQLNYRETEPAIHLGVNDCSGKYMTLQEAAALGQGLLDLVAAARGTVSVALAAAGGPRALRCPPWCEITAAEHAETVANDAAAGTAHVARTGESEAGAPAWFVEAQVWQSFEDGDADVSTVWAEGIPQELPAAQGRSVAAAMLQAAELVDQVGSA